METSKGFPIQSVLAIKCILSDWLSSTQALCRFSETESAASPAGHTHFCDVETLGRGPVAVLPTT